jgi:hypothetical protein
MKKQNISKHWMQDRERRNELIKKIGLGTEIKRAVVDKGHRNGAEIHVISSTGIVTIYNQRTGKLITKLIARPGKIRQYYKEGEMIPEDLLKIARYHQKMKYHLV